MSNPSIQSRERVLSGMRPTGMLHLGNYMGALHNWVRLQNESQYECYFFIADWHALTTDYADPSQIGQNIHEVALDWIGAGLDPEKCSMFVQSHVPQHAELHLLLSMLTPLGWLERVPTYKEQQENLAGRDLTTYGFLGYPLLQSADILIYQADLVPVGQDQVAHVELTREIARRFNQLYPKASHSEFEGIGRVERLRFPILPEPQVLLTPSPKVPGTDGRKMSKSYGNTILLTDSRKTVFDKFKEMSKGGQRARIEDPGDPDVCPVGDIHRIFSDPSVNEEIRSGCKAASIPCTHCKDLAAQSVWRRLQPIQERRNKFELRPNDVHEILASGAETAQARAESTMQMVRNAMGVKGRYHAHLTTFDHLEQDAPGCILHDLSNFKQWWEIENGSERGDKLREFWRTHMLPGDIALKQNEHRVYTTARNKRVFVPTAREDKHENGKYVFHFRKKSYEVIVLLAWARDYKLRSFAVPQKEYRDAWGRVPKSDEKDFLAELQENGRRFLLRLPGSQPIDVTPYQGEVSPLK